MLYREIIAVCSENHREHINALCGQNVEFLGTFAKLRKSTISLIKSVRLEQLIKFDTNSLYITWRLVHS